MKLKILQARIRQIAALDKNALDIYTDLARMTDDKNLKNQFLAIARDEKKHVAIHKLILSLITR